VRAVLLPRRSEARLATTTPVTPVAAMTRHRPCARSSSCCPWPSARPGVARRASFQSFPALTPDGDDPRGSVTDSRPLTAARPPRRPHDERPGGGQDEPRFPGPIGRLQRQQRQPRAQPRRDERRPVREEQRHGFCWVLLIRLHGVRLVVPNVVEKRCVALSEVRQEALCRESDALSAAKSERFTSIIGQVSRTQRNRMAQRT